MQAPTAETVSLEQHTAQGNAFRTDVMARKRDHALRAPIEGVGNRASLVGPDRCR